MADRHVLGLSGGKDSAALAVFMSEHYPELDLQYFFTDTGEELPEVYEFLSGLEGVLSRPIHRLDPQRNFQFWLKQYGYFLPAPNTRWCTRQLKLRPFQQWIKPWLDAGDTVHSYVAIRADEEHREGYTSTHKNLKIHLPFREHKVDRDGVIEILDRSGIGLPAYYEWRSRSGCTFCFFQQKIEWVRLKERHPDSFEAARAMEKDALDHQSPFTWIQGESLSRFDDTEYVARVKEDFERRKQQASVERANRPNALRAGLEFLDIDELYLDDEGGGSCLVCHK
jgi:3'-phosphoadenosine 5'-phosphosulfate sulfotransferase (PAPS reductase)/FAD synthetase